MTTYAAFLTALSQLSVTGVTRRFEYGSTPPASLNTADLPAQWIQAPTGEDEPSTFCLPDKWPRFRAQLVVAISPCAQGIMSSVWRNCVTMMDNIASALMGASGQSLAASGTSYKMRLGTVTVAGTAFWCVIADVEAEG